MLPDDNDGNSNGNSNGNGNSNNSGNGSNNMNGNGAVYSNGNTDDQVNANANSNSNQEQQYSQLSQNDIQFSSVTLYSEMLLLGVFLWILYLILPKGLRQYMCNSYPKRYAKSKPGREVPMHLLQFNNIAKRDSPRRVMRQYHHHRGGGAPSELSMRSSSTVTGIGAKRNVNMYSNSAAMDMDQRIDSGVTSGRQSLGSIHSNTNNNGSNSSVYSHQSPAVSNTSSTGTWDPHTGMHRAFERFPTTNQHGNGAITPFRVHDPDDKDELIDFFTPGKALVRRVHPPPSLIELESLASFSQASPMPSSKGGGPVDPSPVHPNDSTNHRVPSHMVLSSTLTSLREPGIRLHAHGTQCEPRRIWIQLDVHKEMLEWRTENRSDPKESNENSNGNNFTQARSVQETYTLGPKHMIALQDIIYVDVGKTTSALQLLGEDEISCDVCFSVLTKSGSLDLNAGNKLERDALISCLCLILDTIHLDTGNGNGNADGKSWRDLHIQQGSSISQSTEGTSSYYQESGSGVNSGNGNGNASNGYRTGSSAASPSDSDVFAGIDAMTDVSTAFEEV